MEIKASAENLAENETYDRQFILEKVLDSLDELSLEIRERA